MSTQPEYINRFTDKFIIPPTGEAININNKPIPVPTPKPEDNNKEMSTEEITSLSEPTPDIKSEDKNWYSDVARASGLLGEALNKESPMVGSRPLSAQNVGANSGSNMGSNLNDRASLDVKRDTYYDKLLKSFKN